MRAPIDGDRRPAREEPAPAPPPLRGPGAAPRPAAGARGCAEVHLLDADLRTLHVHPVTATAPTAFHTPLFAGQLSSRLRTAADPFFEGCGHSFELRVQGCLLQPVVGPLWFGVELPTAMEVPLYKRAVAILCLRFVQTWAQGLTWSLGDPARPGDCARLVVPLLAGVPRIVPTPPGQPPPPLEQRLPWTTSEAELKAQPCDGSAFHVGFTYTMALYSTFLDLNDWALVNIPGLRRLPLDSLCSAFRLVVYAAAPDPASHLVGQRTPIWQLLVQRPAPPHPS